MFSEMYTGTCTLPLCTAIVRPMKSGEIVERRDQVLTGFLSLVACAVSTFFTRWASMNGPFFNERVIFYPYFLPRRETIIDDVRLFERVRLPLVCWPHGDTG